MKALLKLVKLISKFFKYVFNFRLTERLSKLELLNRWTSYQLSQDIEDLDRLVHLVNYTNVLKINGETEEIKKIILIEWENRILENKKKL